LKSEILSQERNVVVVRANFDAGEVDSAVGKTVRELSKQAKIKGFRPGHVPRKTLELFFGRPGIYKQTAERMAKEAMETVISECDLDLITNPETEIGSFAEGAPLDIKFTFEVRPEVTLPDISSLTAEKIVYKVTEADVDAAMNQILESNAKLVPIDEERPASKEDFVEVEYSSFSVDEDGNLKEIEHEKKTNLYLQTMRKDIADSIIGHSLAEEISFDIRLEDDYPDARMAGSTIRYKTEILQILKRVVPDADNALASELSEGKFQTVDEFRAELRRQIEDDAEKRAEGSLRESSIKVLAAAAEIDVPESMIERQYNSMRKEQDSRLLRDVGQSLSEYLKNNNLSVDEYDAKLRKNAEEIVRNTLVLDFLAERDEISFTSDDLNEEIMRMAAEIKVNAQALADSLGKNKEKFAEVARRVRTRNTMNHLASLVQVREVDPQETSEAAEVPATGDEGLTEGSDGESAEITVPDCESSDVPAVSGESPAEDKEGAE
jgi:trigger factor